MNRDLKLVLVGGLPGTGKTLLGRLLAKELRCCYLDKDTMTGPLAHAVSGALPTSNKMYDRNSKTYKEKIRPAEYDCLIDQSLENLKNNISVVASAVFYEEVHNSNWIESMKAMVENLGGGLGANLVLVWLTSVPDLAHTRLLSRGAPRDRMRLDAWEDYTQEVDYLFRPSLPHIHIRNEGSLNFSADFVTSIAQRIKDYSEL